MCNIFCAPVSSLLPFSPPIAHKIVIKFFFLSLSSFTSFVRIFYWPRLWMKSFGLLLACFQHWHWCMVWSGSRQLYWSQTNEMNFVGTDYKLTSPIMCQWMERHIQWHYKGAHFEIVLWQSTIIALYKIHEKRNQPRSISNSQTMWHTGNVL